MSVEQNNKKLTKEENKMNQLELKKINKKLTKNLLDVIVLDLLKSESMHGYKILLRIRRNFGVYLGPSTIYPFLKTLEEKGYITSEWDTKNDRPRKVFSLTSKGDNILVDVKQSFASICMQLNKMGMNRFNPAIIQNNFVGNLASVP